MQPCSVCGSVTINAGGYCVQCGTFRGVPEQPPPGGQLPPGTGYPGYPQQPPVAGYPPSGPAATYPTSGAPGYPTSGAPGYPTSGGGYPTSPPVGQPTSGAPGYPTSGAPGYPTSGGGYPTAYPPAHPPAPTPPTRPRSLTVPLVALASTLAVLVAAIVIVVSVRGDDGGQPTADPSRSRAPVTTGEPSPTGNSSGEDCVVGTWRVRSHREEVNNDEFGKLTFTGGEGATATLSADGTGRNDYGSDGTEFNSEYEGKELTLKIRGYVTFHYRLGGGQLYVTDMKSYAKAGIFLDDEQVGQWIAFNPSDDTANYTCSGDEMKQENVLYTTELSRVS